MRIVVHIFITFSSWAFASAIAPLVAGALAEAGQWRWFFCKFSRMLLYNLCYLFSDIFAATQDMNLPICGVAFASVFIFVKLPIPPGTVQEKLTGIDWMYVLFDV